MDKVFFIMLDFFSLFVLAVVIVTLIWLLIFLGGLPGRIAKERGHPQQDAINICGWIGICTGGLFWIIALIWAYTKPNHQDKEKN